MSIGFFEDFDLLIDAFFKATKQRKRMPRVKIYDEDKDEWEDVRDYTPTPSDWQDLEDYYEQQDFYERLSQEKKL